MIQYTLLTFNLFSSLILGIPQSPAARSSIPKECLPPITLTQHGRRLDCLELRVFILEVKTNTLEELLASRVGINLRDLIENHLAPIKKEIVELRQNLDDFEFDCVDCADEIEKLERQYPTPGEIATKRYVRDLVDATVGFRPLGTRQLDSLIREKIAEAVSAKLQDYPESTAIATKDYVERLASSKAGIDHEELDTMLGLRINRALTERLRETEVSKLRGYLSPLNLPYYRFEPNRLSILDRQRIPVFQGGLGSGGQGELRLDFRNGDPASILTGTDYGGQLRIHAKSGAPSVTLGTGLTGDGFAEFRSDDGQQLAYLGADTDRKGLLVLRHSNSQPIVTIGSNPESGGGWAIFRNVSGDETARIGTNELGVAIEARGSDIAERFLASHGIDIPPGTVVALSGTQYEVRPSQKAYDNRVIGVVCCAGNLRPGILLGPDHPRSVPVTIHGQVYVRVSGEGGPIQTGDVLVSSSVSGLAMKANNSLRAINSGLGKAMESFKATTKGEQGLIRILR